MANLNTKYLDYKGLGRFLNHLKEYIGDEIAKIHGDNLNLYDGSVVNNPTITSQIEDLWEMLGTSDGVNGSLAENIATILGEYVKSINVPTDQNLPIALKIEEVDGEDNKGRFTISLVDNGLNDALTTPKVTSLNTANDGGDVTLSLDNTTGAVTITVNSKSLTELVNTIKSGLDAEIDERKNADLALGTRIDGLDERIETIEGSYVKSIKTTNSNTDSSYIDITPSDKTNGDVEIIINDSTLHEKLTKIDKDIADEIENREKADEVLDGKIGDVAIDLGTLGGTVDGLSGKLNKEIEDRITEDGKLDERIETIESSYVKNISSTNSSTKDTKYIDITSNTKKSGEVTININDGVLSETIDSVLDNQSNMANQILALAAGLSLTVTASPSTIYKNTSTSITITATTKDATGNVTASEIKIMDGDTVLKTASDVKTTSVAKAITTASNTYTLKAEATVNGMKLGKNTSVNARYPVYYGMGISASDVKSKNVKASARTTAVSNTTYDATAEANGVRFYLLVPNDVTRPSSFTMGGAPVDMTYEDVTLDGIVYRAYYTVATYNVDGEVKIKAQ